MKNGRSVHKQNFFEFDFFVAKKGIWCVNKRLFAHGLLECNVSSDILGETNITLVTARKIYKALDIGKFFYIIIYTSFVPLVPMKRLGHNDAIAAM